MDDSRSRKKLDRTQLKPFTEVMDCDKKLEEFLTDEERDQMKARTKMFFETLWKAMGR